MVMKTYRADRYSGIRRDMLDDTVKFLSWALKHPEYFPRIPRVKIDPEHPVRFSARIKKTVWGIALKALEKIPYVE
jgi:hypothetical protein